MNRLDDLLPLLQCPVSGAPVHFDGGAEPRCWSESSDRGRIDFPAIAGQPVLIDFANSVVEREALLQTGAASLIEGRRMRRSLAKRVLLGRNKVEVSNATQLLGLIRQEAQDRAPVLLVIGGGTITEGVQVFRDAGDVRTISFDVYASTNTDFVADAHAIPLRDGCVDAVWIQAVLEHVLSPHHVAAEVARVLRPGGRVYAETPFLQPVHEGPYDFTRFTESGHRWLFRDFEVIDSGVVSGPGTVLFQLVRRFSGALLRSQRLGSLVAMPFFWLRFLDRLVPPGHASDLASGVYFLGRKSDDPIAPSAMPDFFRGVRKAPTR